MLRSALPAGYYKWSRENDGGEVAGMLDVTQPTVNTHLRMAQRKSLQILFESGGRTAVAPWLETGYGRQRREPRGSARGGSRSDGCRRIGRVDVCLQSRHSCFQVVDTRVLALDGGLQFVDAGGLLLQSLGEALDGRQ